MLRIVPEIQKESMEKLLSFLPEPIVVYTNIFGGNEAIDSKFTETFLNKYPGLEISLNSCSTNGTPEYRLNKPSKKKIIELAFPENFSYDFPRVAFSSAKFELDGVNIEIDRTSVKIKYTIEGSKKMLELLSNVADIPYIETVSVDREIKWY